MLKKRFILLDSKGPAGCNVVFVRTGGVNQLESVGRGYGDFQTLVYVHLSSARDKPVRVRHLSHIMKGQEGLPGHPHVNGTCFHFLLLTRFFIAWA